MAITSAGSGEGLLQELQSAGRAKPHSLRCPSGQRAGTRSRAVREKEGERASPVWDEWIQVEAVLGEDGQAACPDDRGAATGGTGMRPTPKAPCGLRPGEKPLYVRGIWAVVERRTRHGLVMVRTRSGAHTEKMQRRLDRDELLRLAGLSIAEQVDELVG